MIKETTVKPIRKTLLCDACQTEMTFTGHGSHSPTLLYTHTCPSCKAIQNVDKIYPYIEYVESI